MAMPSVTSIPYTTISQDEHGVSLAVIAHERASEVRYSDDQIDLLKRTVARGLTDNEFAFLVALSKRRQLDLFAHQLYGVKRGDEMTPQTGIDGYRLMAARSRCYAGSDKAVFSGTPGTTGFSAEVTVYRMTDGQRCPFTAEVYWEEFCPDGKNNNDRMWRKMPRVMLAKCGEAAALRKAFPEEVSGIYIHEEMEQANNKPATAAPIRNQGDGRRVVDAAKPAPVVHVNEDTGEVTRAAAPAAEKPAPKSTAPNWGKARRAAVDIGAKSQAQFEQFIADVLHIGLVAASDLRQLSMTDYDAVMKAIENRLVDSALAADEAKDATTEQQPEQPLEYDLHDLHVPGKRS